MAQQKIEFKLDSAGKKMGLLIVKELLLYHLNTRIFLKIKINLSLLKTMKNSCLIIMENPC